jgi:hypothetical protein
MAASGRDPAAGGQDSADGAGTGAVGVRGRTDRRQTTVGTPFRYTVEVSAPRAAELIVPVLGGQLGEFTVVDFGEEPAREEDGRVVTSRWYDLVAYRPGYLLVPGLTVQYRLASGELQRADGEDVAIVVASLLEQEPDAQDIREIKGPVAVPFDWTPIGVAAGVLGTIVLIAVAGARLLRRINAPALPPPPRPAHVEALDALERLRQRRLSDAAERTQWYVTLSAIVRTYIESRFGLRAPEMTTEEFIHAVQRDSPLRPVHRELLGDFLGECDLVKFARHQPDQEAAVRAYDAARAFVMETRPAEAAEEGRRAV